jgi:hypothetical protein
VPKAPVAASGLLANNGLPTAGTGFRSKTLYPSHHGCGDETTDHDLQRLAERPIVVGPDHRVTSAVRLLDNGFVRDVPPLALDVHAVVAVPYVPVGVGQRRAVCVGTAWPLATFEALEPAVEFGAAMIVRVGPEVPDQQHYHHSDGDPQTYLRHCNLHKQTRDLHRDFRDQLIQTAPGALTCVDRTKITWAA